MKEEEEGMECASRASSLPFIPMSLLPRRLSSSISLDRSREEETSLPIPPIPPSPPGPPIPPIPTVPSTSPTPTPTLPATCLSPFTVVSLSRSCLSIIVKEATDAEDVRRSRSFDSITMPLPDCMCVEENVRKRDKYVNNVTYYIKQYI